MKPPKTKYTEVGESLVAYQVLGEAPIDLVYAFGMGAIEAYWEHPAPSRFLEGLSAFSRVILFDPRGWGSSDRLPFDRFPTWEDWTEDMHAVMDAVGSVRAAIVTHSMASTIGFIFAATYPDRTSALIPFNSRAKWIASDDYPWGHRSQEDADQVVALIERMWGTEEFGALTEPTMAGDERYMAWNAKGMRVAGSPRMAAAQVRYMHAFDSRSLLPLIQAPTMVLHRKNAQFVPIEHGRYLAAHIPGAKLVELPGVGESPWIEAGEETLGHIEEFLTGVRRAPEAERVLATVLFTDIVGSTERAASIGDRNWKELLNAHDSMVRERIEEFRGRYVNTTGDGLLATFDGPARAIRCARVIIDEVRKLGIEVRAGLHSGEIELRGEDVGGIAVHIGARVASLAAPSEVLVSRTVTDLVAGSGIAFEDRGAHSLKGVPGEWRLFAVRG